MKKIMNYQKSLLLLLLLLAGMLGEVQAQVVVRHRPGVTVVRRPVAPVYAPVRRVVVTPRAVVVAPRRIVVVPPVFRGVVITALPAFYTVTYVGGVSYYYSDGVYYVKTDQPGGSKESYKSVMPPVGTVVPSLPDGTQTFQVDGKTYFEYDHVAYKEVIVNGAVKYEVTGYTNLEDAKEK